MHQLTIRSNILKRGGGKQTLNVALAHNMRKISAEFGPYGRIDPQRTHLNVSLVTPPHRDLESFVVDQITAMGIDLNHSRYKKKNRGYGIEFLFTVSQTLQCDFKSLYTECLKWLRKDYAECPVVSACIHFDEDKPHLHVIIIPIYNGDLQADKIKGYKGLTNKRQRALYNYLDGRYPLTFPEKLQGAQKKAAADLAITAIESGSVPQSTVQKMTDQALISAIRSRPETFLQLLGISREDVARAATKQVQHKRELPE